QATINNGRVTIQPIQGRQNFGSAGSSRTFTSGQGGAQGKQRVITCYNCKGEDNLAEKIAILKDDLQKEESKNIDRELALEKEVKELNNIVFKRNQSAQTVHMLTKPQVFYNHATRQALGFQNPRYLKKVQQLKQNLYDGSVIGKSDVIVLPDFENTLMHAEESRSKMIAKQNDPQLI
nr:hypothetical protein [Tanacetum cinerariifolium]